MRKLLALLALAIAPPLAAQAVPCRAFTTTRTRIGTTDSILVTTTARCRLIHDTLRITKTDTLTIVRVDTVFVTRPDTVVPPPPPPPDTQPPAPPAPGEPSFDPATGTLLYRDAFDYASTTALLTAYPDRAQLGGTISLDAGALRVDWNRPCGTSDADVKVSKSIGGSDSRDLYTSWTTQTSVGYDWKQCAPDHKVVIWDQGSSERTVWNISWGGEVPILLCASSGDAWCRGFVFQVSLDKSQYNEYKATAPKSVTDPLLAALSNGQPHRWTVHMRKETALNRCDGFLGMWIDGVQVMNRPNACTGVLRKLTNINYPTTRNGGGTGWLRMDNVTVWAGR